MKPCPFCAESIQDAAIKCRFCMSDLRSPDSVPVTAIRQHRKGKVHYLIANGSVQEFWDTLVAAVSEADLPIRQRDRSAGTFLFESKGGSLMHMSGEEIFVEISEVDGGSSARFMSKAKPKGMIRATPTTDAGKWVARIASGLPIVT